MNPVDVVSAVIVENGRILLTQRRPDKDFPFTWECPGGKVDDGETNRVALRRELREELGVGVKDIVEGALWTGEFFGDVARKERAHIALSFYRVELWPDTRPSPLEKQGLGWFLPYEMRNLVLAPGNAAAFYAIMAAMGVAPEMAHSDLRP